MLYVLSVLTDMNNGLCRYLVAGLRRELNGLDFDVLKEEMPNLVLWMFVCLGRGGAVQ